MSKVFDAEEPIHEWFGLSYSNYLVLPRSVLQSMPVEWQRKFVKCLDELVEATRDLEDLPSEFLIRARGEGNRFIEDPYGDYERGRRKVKLNVKECGHEWRDITTFEDLGSGKRKFVCASCCAVKEEAP